MTNGIPPCKALVMAGESATNDVDEEVYDNDGNARNQAREASAGDRRAIADADENEQLDISGEAKTASTQRTPGPPTNAARMAHNATHVPFKDWCPICCESWTKFSAQTSGGEHVKSIPPTTENWLRKLCTYSMKNNTSTEDKHETNHINNKYNDTNTDTRKLHNM